MQKIVKYSFYFGIFICFFSIVLILLTNAYLKPSLPKIKLVDEAKLQMPLKVYTKDGILIGEFGEKKEDQLIFLKFLKTLKMPSLLLKMIIFLTIKVLVIQA